MNKKELKNEAEQYSYDVPIYQIEPQLEKIQKAYLAGAEPREKRIEELEKENAELKGIKDVATLIRANNDTVITLMQLNNKLVSKNQQLTKAKELLKQFLEAKNGEDTYKAEWEAEQFLKDSEVEK